MSELSHDAASPSGHAVETWVARIQRARQVRIARLYRHEKDWRLRPGDGGDPTIVSPEALRRELVIERELEQWTTAQLRAGLRPSQTELVAQRSRIKHFPVLLISAPHVEDAVNGSFPGIPTPLLYATALLDRLLRIDEFPGPTCPDIVAVMNPSVYVEKFERELIATLRRYRPVLVGISNLSEGHFYALRIAGIVKRTVPEAIVLLGGQHEDAVDTTRYRSASQRVSLLDGRLREQRAIFELGEEHLARLGKLQTLATPEDRQVVDVVFAGDAPYAFVELLKTLAQAPYGGVELLKRRILARRDDFARLAGAGRLWFVDTDTGRTESVELGGAVIDGNALPFIDVTGLTQENRFSVFGGRKTAQIMACLGCKYSCAFCHESADAFLSNVPKFRQRTPEHVLKEILLRIEQGFEAVFFDDSTFTQNRRWVRDFMDLLDRTATDQPLFEWGCQTTINDVDEPLLRRMAATGCSYVYFGVESADPQVQKARQLRAVTDGISWADQFRRVAHWCHDAGIRVGTSLQFGLGESHANRVATMTLIAELHERGDIPDGCVALNINSPYPGTQQWLGLLKAGDSLPDYRQRLCRHTGFETAHQFSSVTGETVDEIFQLAVERLGAAIHSGKTRPRGE